MENCAKRGHKKKAARLHFEFALFGLFENKIVQLSQVNAKSFLKYVAKTQSIILVSLAT